MAGHRTRYRAIEKWLVRSRSHQWVNRHLQAYGWISKLWLTEGLMSIRRQMDDQHGSISLKQLLHEIESRSDVPLGLNRSEVAADREGLQDACASALAFAQRQLAHRTPWDDAFVSLSALDVALDAIDNIAHKYHLAITNQKLVPTEPEPDPDWLRSFEVAWRKPPKRRTRHLRPGRTTATR